MAIIREAGWRASTAPRRCATSPTTRWSSLHRAVPAEEFEALPGVSDVVAEDHVLRMRVSGNIAPVVRAAARYELADFVSREPSPRRDLPGRVRPRTPVEAGVMTAGNAPCKPARPRCLGRLYGLGSIFGKTIRDSRRATIVAAALLALVFLGVSRAIVAEFATPESRT